MIIVKTRKGSKTNPDIWFELPDSSSGDYSYILYWNSYYQRYTKIL